MKIIAAFTLFVVGISAFPQFPQTKLSANIDFTNERLVTDAIVSAIQDISQSIQDAGLDPLSIESYSISYALPVPVLFSGEAVIEEFLFAGLSNIVINNINFSLITTRLTFDISLPLVEASLTNAATDVTFFGKQYTASASGRLAIVNLGISGNVRVNVGIISGISIRSIDLNFGLGGIESALNVVVQDNDLSDYLNTLLGTTIPTTLDTYSDEINELLEILVQAIADQIL